MRVELFGVGHRFGTGPWLFRGVDYAFQPGRLYALTGPSGSGKSTLLSILAYMQSPREGRVHSDRVPKTRWVFQNPFGSPRRSALDHVALPMLGSGAGIGDAEARGRELLGRFGLDHAADRPFAELSGGEAQRLMLARALASEPELLLVDEPTAQLDRSSAARVDRVLGATADAKTIVVVATHDSRTRDACTDRLDLSEFAGGAEP